MGYSPWGHKRVGHDLDTKQQKQSEWYWSELEKDDDFGEEKAREKASVLTF